VIVLLVLKNEIVLKISDPHEENEITQQLQGDPDGENEMTQQLQSDHYGENEITQQLQSDADEENKIIQQLQRHVLKRGVKFDEMDDTDSHVLALDWLLYEDEMELQVSDFNLNQRYILALLAFEFGDLFRSQVDWLSSGMECSWDWVTCNGELEVTKLELG
jgi:hypothetical protein